MSYVDEVLDRVIRENPNEPEFHQAVKEVLNSLRPVVDANEEKFRKDALLERLVNPERQLKFRVPWVDDTADAGGGDGAAVDLDEFLGPDAGLADGIDVGITRDDHLAATVKFAAYSVDAIAGRTTCH